MKFRLEVLHIAPTIPVSVLVEAAKSVLKGYFHQEVSVDTGEKALYAIGRVDPASDDFVICVGPDCVPEIDLQHQGGYSQIFICSYHFDRGHDWEHESPKQRNDSQRKEMAVAFQAGMEAYLKSKSF